MTLNEWKENMMESVEGIVYISCIMNEVPYYPNTARYQVYNQEGTFDQLYDITTDSNGDITKIE